VPTNSSAAGPPRPPALLTVIGRHRLGLAGLAVIASLAVIALLLRLSVHARGPGLDLALLPCVPLAAFARRWPLPVLGLATALGAVSMGSGGSSLGLSLMLGVAGYIVAAGLPRRSSIRAVVTAAAALAVSLALAGITRASLRSPPRAWWVSCRWRRRGSLVTAWPRAGVTWRDWPRPGKGFSLASAAAGPAFGGRRGAGLRPGSGRSSTSPGSTPT
jgi:hypothetical protein